jgi:rSAM/selenodomain-associated transferase 1
MVRQPVAGRIKSRLAREIGVVAATGFYRHTATAVITRLAADRRWRTWLAVTPDPTATAPVWPPSVPRRGQGSGDLGQRMGRIMRWPGAGPIVIVGSDIPTIAPAHVARAFRALGRADVVFGPALDGGYWLVGMRRSPRVPRAFDGVRWSTEDALADTLVSLERCRIELVERLSDVDGRMDYERSCAMFGRRVLPAHCQGRLDQAAFRDGSGPRPRSSGY